MLSVSLDNVASNVNRFGLSRMTQRGECLFMIVNAIFANEHLSEIGKNNDN